MDIKSLAVYADLAQTLHFGRTAEKHYMSPSTLSRLIQRLEDEASVSLFRRSNRKVSLTRAGERYLQFVRETLQAWQAFEGELGIGSEQLHGTVSLYCSVTASHSLLAGLFTDLHERQPGIEIKLHTGDQALSLHQLNEGGDDFAIATRPEKPDRQIAFKTLSSSKLIFIAPKNVCAVREKINRLEQGKAADWSQLPWIIAERGLARSRLDKWFRQQHIKPDIYAQVTGHEAIVSMVGLGCGVGVVPELVLTNSPVFDSIEILEDESTQAFLPYAEFEIGLCALKQRLSEPLMQAVWDGVVTK